MWPRKYYTYLLTNAQRTVLYTGMTNDLARRLVQHFTDINPNSFTCRYQVYFLVWFEETKYVLNAINLEKEIKNWPRAKKDALIATANPNWEFLNAEILGHWPPSEDNIKEAWRHCHEG